MWSLQKKHEEMGGTKEIKEERRERREDWTLVVKWMDGIVKKCLEVKLNARCFHTNPNLENLNILTDSWWMNRSPSDMSLLTPPSPQQWTKNVTHRVRKVYSECVSVHPSTHGIYNPNWAPSQLSFFFQLSSWKRKQPQLGSERTHTEISQK